MKQKLPKPNTPLGWLRREPRSLYPADLMLREGLCPATALVPSELSWPEETAMCPAKLASLLEKQQLYLPGRLNWLLVSPLRTAIQPSFKTLHEGSLARCGTPKKQHSSKPDVAADQFLCPTLPWGRAKLKPVLGKKHASKQHSQLQMKPNTIYVLFGYGEKSTPSTGQVPPSSASWLVPKNTEINQKRVRIRDTAQTWLFRRTLQRDQRGEMRIKQGCGNSDQKRPGETRAIRPTLQQGEGCFCPVTCHPVVQQPGNSPTERELHFKQTKRKSHCNSLDSLIYRNRFITALREFWWVP